MDRRYLILTLALILGAITQAKAAPCLTVTITGAQGGPQAYVPAAPANP